MGRANVSLHPTERPGASRRLFFFVALFSLVFIAYGSLVPLDFQAVPIDEAWQRFLVPFDRPLSLGSRVDVATNVLLTIPLAFFLLGAVWPDKPGWARLFVSGLVWLSCLFVSFAVEFAQIFFSGRTPSASDVLAQTVGALIGIGLWCWQGQVFSIWLRGWQRARGQKSLAERFLWVYVAVLFGYGLLPLDLTLSPVDLYQKWSAGRVNLLPFAFQSRLRMQDAYDLVTDVLLWVPVSYLWIVSGKKGRKQAWAWSAIAAVSLELSQLLVFSRVTDVTDLISAWLGAFVGVILARPRTTDRISRHSRSVYFQTYLGFLGFALYALALAAIFWYPFDFNFERSFLRDQASSFFGTPLHAYYVSTPFRAVTEVLHKTLFFVPLGIAFAFARLPFEASRYRRLFDVAAVAAIGLVAAGIELGQMALVDKHAGSTDLVLEWLGAIVGYIGFIMLARRWTEHAGPTPAPTGSSGARPHASPAAAVTASSPQQSAHEYAPSSYAQLHAAYAPYLQARQAQPDPILKPASGDVSRTWGRYLFALVLMTVALWLVTSSELAPYNLRELTEKFPPPFGALGLLLAALVAFSPAALIGRTLSESQHLKPLLLLVFFGHVLLLYLVLRVALPLESIDDIIGSVRPAGTAELERFLRFAGFFLFVGTAVAGGVAAWFALRSIRPQRIGRWLLLGALGFLIGDWAIVVKASTDNLVELIRGRGSLIGMAALYLWFWVTSFHAVLGVVWLRRKLSLPISLVATLFLLPLAYGLFWVALEPHVVKYQQAFSAIQFLLSPDRENYVFGSELVIRFVLMQFGLLLLMGFAFYPALRGERLPNRVA